jgi:hypothetical protein
MLNTQLSVSAGLQPVWSALSSHSALLLPSQVAALMMFGARQSEHSTPKPDVVVPTQKSHPVLWSFGFLPGPQAVHVSRSELTTFGNGQAKHSPDAEKSSVLAVYTQPVPTSTLHSRRSLLSSQFVPPHAATTPLQPVQLVRFAFGPSPGGQGVQDVRASSTTFGDKQTVHSIPKGEDVLPMQAAHSLLSGLGCFPTPQEVQVCRLAPTTLGASQDWQLPVAE